MNAKTISKTFDKIKETEEIISSNAERIVINGATMTRDIINTGLETTQDLYDRGIYQTQQEIFVPDQMSTWNLPELQEQLIDYAEEKLKLGGDLITNIYNISSDLYEMVDEKEHEIDGYLESFKVYSTARKYTTYMNKSILPRFTVRVYERTKRNIAWGLATYQIVTKGIQKSEEKSQSNDHQTFKQDDKIEAKEEIVDKIETSEDNKTKNIGKKIEDIKVLNLNNIKLERENEFEVHKIKEVSKTEENSQESNSLDASYTDKIDVSQNEDFPPKANRSDVKDKGIVDNELNEDIEIIDVAKDEIEVLNENNQQIGNENIDDGCRKDENTYTNNYDAIKTTEDEYKSKKFEECPKVITQETKINHDIAKYFDRNGEDSNDKSFETCTNTLDLSNNEARPMNKGFKEMESFASLEDMIIVGSNPYLNTDREYDENSIENDDHKQITKENNNSKRLIENTENEVDGKTNEEHDNKSIDYSNILDNTYDKTVTSSKENDEDISNRLVLNHWDDMWDNKRLKANGTNNKDKVEANGIERTRKTKIVNQLSSTPSEQDTHRPKLAPKPKITINGPNVKMMRRSLQTMGSIPETQVIPVQASSVTVNSQQKFRKYKSEVRMNPSEGAKQNIGTIHVVEPKTSTPKSINPYKVRVQIFGRSPAGPVEQKESREKSELYQSGNKISWLQKMAVKKSL